MMEMMDIKEEKGTNKSEDIETTGDLRDMSSRRNSLEDVKEKYKRAIIDNFIERMTRLLESRDKNGRVHGEEIEKARREFNYIEWEIAPDYSLGSNSRWGIVSRKNFFGLEAEMFPSDTKIGPDTRLFLKAISGRFQMDKFPMNIFPNRINISDMLDRNEEEQFKEIEEFFNMTNKEVFEKYGVSTNRQEEMNLLANCVILDSLLKGRYSEIKDIFCWQPRCNSIEIELKDGTKIIADTESRPNRDYSEKCRISIEENGNTAIVIFDTKNIGKNQFRLTDINDLEVDYVYYQGDDDLIAKLEQAMQEQFKSQQGKNEEQIQPSTVLKNALQGTTPGQIAEAITAEEEQHINEQGEQTHDKQ